MDSIKNVVRKQTNSDTAVIPGGLTGHIQAADMSWNNHSRLLTKLCIRIGC